VNMQAIVDAFDAVPALKAKPKVRHGAARTASESESDGFQVQGFVSLSRS
jgi:hypothetical protein